MAKRRFPKLNGLLEELDVKLADLAPDREERARLHAFEAAGGLDRPAYALSPGMEGFDIAPLVQEHARHAGALARLKDPARNDTGYAPGNGYYDSPDADALYLMVRRFAPERVIEVGCGNSTRVTRQAVIDGGGDAHHRDRPMAARRHCRCGGPVRTGAIGTGRSRAVRGAWTR
ncbi:hypothetical protein ACFOHS_05645 [Jhaorihella thermophila]